MATSKIAGSATESNGFVFESASEQRRAKLCASGRALAARPQTRRAAVVDEDGAIVFGPTGDVLAAFGALRESAGSYAFVVDLDTGRPLKWKTPWIYDQKRMAAAVERFRLRQAGASGRQQA